MCKIILSLFSIFMNIMFQDYFEFYEEPIKDSILLELENYQVINDDMSKYKLCYGTEILWEYSSGTNIKLVKNDQYLVSVSNYQGFINIKAFDNFNRLIYDKTLPNKYIDKFDVCFFNNKLVIVSGISKYDTDFYQYKKPYFGGVDAFFCIFDHEFEIENIKIYGGKLNEYFSSITINNNYLYLTGKKDSLSGGDFGNGGGKDFGYICVKLNNHFILEKYCTLKEKVHHLLVYDNEIVLHCEYNIYYLNKQLESLYSISLEKQSLFGLLTFNKLSVTIYDNLISIIDLETQTPLATHPIDKFKEVKIIGEKFVFSLGDSKKALSIYDLRKFKNNYIYDGDKKNQTINNLFSEIPLTNTIITPAFNPLVYGEYLVDYYYQDFKISGKINVPFEANVSEDFIYPIGYRLRFTGNGYLDGELITNNHAVYETGNHQLILYGCNGEKKTINFKIDKDQISFTEYQDKTWDLEAYPNQEFYIIIQHPFTEYEVSNVIINNGDHKDIIAEKNKLIIVLEENLSGIYYYQVQKITFKINGREIERDLNYEFKVNVLKNSLEINSEFTDDDKYIYYNALVADADAEIRGLNIKAIGGGDELYFNFPICDRNLLLTGLDINKKYHCIINLTINEGNGILKDFPLFNFDLIPKNENIRIGELNIIQKGQTLEKFKIMLEKDKSIPILYLENDIIYEYQSPQYGKAIFISIIFGILIFGFTFFIHNRRKIKAI